MIFGLYILHLLFVERVGIHETAKVTDTEAVAREMIEETGLTVEVGRLIGRVQRPGLNGAVVDIRDYAATVTGGTLRPGDDAADARWVAPGDLGSLEITEGLIDALTAWGVLSL